MSVSVERETAGLIPVIETKVVSTAEPPTTMVSFSNAVPEGSIDRRTFVGIGVVFGPQKRANGTVEIIDVLPGSPAKAAGLNPPFIIHKVDGVSLKGLSQSEAARLIRGPAGSKVRLEVSEVFRDKTIAAEFEKFTVELTRKELEL